MPRIASSAAPKLVDRRTSKVSIQKMLSALLLLLAQSTALLRTAPMTAHKVVMRDSDRCYYGDVDDAGNVDGARRATKRPQRERVALRSPDPALSPLDVVEQQFHPKPRATSRPLDARAILGREQRRP